MLTKLIRNLLAQAAPRLRHKPDLADVRSTIINCRAALERGPDADIHTQLIAALQSLPEVPAGIVEAEQHAWNKRYGPEFDQRDNKPPVIALTLGNSAQMLLPDSLDVITRYVMEERGDWFEAEMLFVRKLLQPGMRVVDVGANYGVYALSAAAAVGSAGRVWAFEPDAAVAELLQGSRSLNGFAQLEVIVKAVADTVGEGFLDISGNSELNHLVGAGSDSGRTIKIAVATLDDYREKLGCSSIDFVKIDAEGQESAVVRGAHALLTSDQPLVMAEFKHGRGFNEAMLDEFASIGFAPYVLIPGLMLLAPFDRSAPVDVFLLNLFFCSAQRATQLAERQLLCPARPAADQAAHTDAEVLACHARALREDLLPSARLAALQDALAGSELLVHLAADALDHRLNHARLLADSGCRERACEAYSTILERLRRGEFDPGEAENALLPLTPTLARPSGGIDRNWLTAVVADWLRTHITFSAFFAPADTVRLLDVILATPHLGTETRRQKQLIMRRWYGDSILAGSQLDVLCPAASLSRTSARR